MRAAAWYLTGSNCANGIKSEHWRARCGRAGGRAGKDERVLSCVLTHRILCTFLGIHFETPVRKRGGHYLYNI